MNYNNAVKFTHGRRTYKTNYTAAQQITTRPWHNHAPKLRRPMNGNKSRTRPATICTPRGGQRYKPRPGPRRHPLTHAAGIGQTSPQRRHQHKARAMSHVHGPQPPHMIRHNQSHPAMYQSTIQSRVALFFIGAKPAAGPNGIKALRHQSASSSSSTLSNTDSKGIPCS